MGKSTKVALGLISVSLIGFYVYKYFEKVEDAFGNKCKRTDMKSEMIKDSNNPNKQLSALKCK